MKNRLILCLYFIVITTATFAQSTNSSVLEQEATVVSSKLFTLLQQQKKPELQAYVIDIATLQTMARGYQFSGEKEKNNFVNHAEVQQQRMSKSVNMSYDKALLKLKTQGVDIAKMKILNTKIELKKEREIPTMRITLTVGNAKEQHVLYIDGLIYHNSKWWLTEGYNYWK
jgi:hypothetical protein